MHKRLVEFLNKVWTAKDQWDDNQKLEMISTIYELYSVNSEAGEPPGEGAVAKFKEDCQRLLEHKKMEPEPGPNPSWYCHKNKPQETMVKMYINVKSEKVQNVFARFVKLLESTGAAGDDWRGGVDQVKMPMDIRKSHDRCDKVVVYLKDGETAKRLFEELQRDDYLSKNDHYFIMNWVPATIRIHKGISVGYEYGDRRESSGWVLSKKIADALYTLKKGKKFEGTYKEFEQKVGEELRKEGINPETLKGS
jgi:hypothetical protein